MALEGRKIFLKYRCLSCHSADENARAPVLENLYGKAVPLQSGGVVRADENYLRESILYPSAKIVAGYENIMPHVQGANQRRGNPATDCLHPIVGAWANAAARRRLSTAAKHAADQSRGRTRRE